MSAIHPWDPPTIHPWGTQIDNHVFLAKLCCLSDNFTTYETLLATSVEGAVDYTTTLNNYSPGNKASDTIKSYNTACVGTAQTAYNTFASTVSNLASTTVNEKTWTTTIDDAAIAAKDAANSAIDIATTNVKTFISGLPAGAQNAAAQLFVAGMKVVMNFFSTVWMKIKEILASISQFLEGIWGVLKSATGAVLGAARGAIAYITGGAIGTTTGGTAGITTSYSNMVVVKADLKQIRANPKSYDVTIPFQPK